MAFESLKGLGESVISPEEHQKNLSTIGSYHKKYGMNPNKLSHAFGETEKDEFGKEIVDPTTGKAKLKMTPFSEFSKDPKLTKTYMEQMKISEPKPEKSFSPEELSEKYEGNFFSDIAGDIDYHKKSGSGIMSYMSEMLPEVESDPTLYDSIIDVAPENAFAPGDLEGALKFLYNADDATKAKIQNAYHKNISKKIR